MVIYKRSDHCPPPHNNMIKCNRYKDNNMINEIGKNLLFSHSFPSSPSAYPSRHPHFASSPSFSHVWEQPPLSARSHGCTEKLKNINLDQIFKNIFVKKCESTQKGNYLARGRFYAVVGWTRYCIKWHIHSYPSTLTLRIISVRIRSLIF